MARACFVTATDTEVGKTILAATLVAGLLADGVAARARKPIATGATPSARWRAPGPDAELSGLADHELLAAVSGERPDAVVAELFEPAVSPQLAAGLAGRPIDPATIVTGLRAAAGRAEALIVEGIGGLLVPIAGDFDVRRLAAMLAWPVVVVARPGLGTINHTLLTLEAARAASLDVRAVVLTPWPAEPGTIERSNRETIARLGNVEVAVLPQLQRVTRASLAAAATTIDYDRWLAA